MMQSTTARGSGSRFWERIFDRFGLQRRLVRPRVPLVLLKRSATPEAARSPRPAPVSVSQHRLAFHLHLRWPEWLGARHVTGTTAHHTSTVLSTVFRRLGVQPGDFSASAAVRADRGPRTVPTALVRQERPETAADAVRAAHLPAPDRATPDIPAVSRVERRGRTIATPESAANPQPRPARGATAPTGTADGARPAIQVARSAHPDRSSTVLAKSRERSFFQRRDPIVARTMRQRAAWRNGRGPASGMTVSALENPIGRVLTRAVRSAAAEPADLMSLYGPPVSRTLAAATAAPPAPQPRPPAPASVVSAAIDRRPAPQPAIDVGRLSDEVYRHIQRRVRIERERRGL